jgi:hypothetical protein
MSSPGFRPSHNTHEAAAAATLFSKKSNVNRPPSANGATAPRLPNVTKNVEIGQPGGYKSKKRITHKRRHTRRHTRRHRGRTRSRR